MAQINFNAATVTPAKPIEPVPSDWYNVVIDESEKKVTNDGEGEYLQIRMAILDGPYANQKLWHRFNLENKSKKTVLIAEEQLSAICYAVGVIQVPDSSALHGKPYQAKVLLIPPTTNPTTGRSYEASNECKGFKAIEVGTGASGIGGGVPSWPTENTQQQGEPAQAQQQPAPIVISEPWKQQQQEPTVSEPPTQVATDSGTDSTTTSPQKDEDELPPWMTS